MTIRIVLADDHDDVRHALRNIVERERDIRVVGEARSGNELLSECRAHRPDVLLVDIRMPQQDGISALRELYGGPDGDQQPRSIVLTTYNLDDYVYAALRAGASGFLLKNAVPSDIRRAIRLVHEGNALLDPAVTGTVIERFGRESRSAPLSLDHLTPREREIVELVAQGLNNQEIGSTLSISYWTVKTHIARILEKLDARDRTQIVIAAYEAGIRPGTR